MNRTQREAGAARCLSVIVAVGLGLALGGCDDKLGIGTTPTIRVSPTTVSFGSVAIGDEEPKTITITNIGGGELTVSALELTPTSSSDFVFEPPALPRKLQRNQSMTFEVIYRPQNVGADTGRIIVRSSDRANPAVNVDLRTLDIGPSILVEPDPLDFGVVERGMTKTLSATILNEGFAPLIIDNMTTVSGSDFAVTSPTTFPLTIEPGESAPMSATYTPSGCAPDIEVIEIYSNDANRNPYQLGVKGQPPGPAISATPTAVNFGATDLGTTATKVVTLKSVGTAALRVSAIFTGAGSDTAFSIQMPPTTPASLNANQTLDVTVAFRPSMAGFARGALVVSSDDCDKPQYQIPLEGIGTEGPAALIQVSPSTINFGNVAQGTMSERQMTVTSIGQLPLQVSGVSLAMGTPSTFSLPQTAGFTLPACTGTPCPSQNVTVRFAPTAVGAAMGTAVVASNAANEPRAQVGLQGTGTMGATCSLRVTPGTLNFGDVAINTTRDLSVTLQNNGSGSCTFTSATLLNLLPPFVPTFRIQSAPAASTLIGPGQSRQVTVRIAPTATNELLYGLLTVNWTDPQNPGANPGAVNVNLTARSVEARIAAIPGRVDFGLVTVGCASPVTTVRVFNAGSAPLTINAVRLQNNPSRFRIVQAPSPGTIIGGAASNPQSVDVRVQYVPNAVGASMDTLIIESSDPARPMLPVPLLGQGTNIVDVVDKFLQPTEPKVDILFVIDNSGSMSEEQRNLRTNFTAFANFARSLNVSYQIGVVTTDNAKLRGNPKIIRSSDADPVAAFGRNANVGDSGDGTERGLEMAYQALSEPLISADNVGFLRNDASLEIIMVSDEEDQSPATLDFYTTFYFSIKGARNTNLLHVSSIAGDVPGGCNSNNGSAEAGQRYKEVANRTAGVFGSICDASFATTLQAIGNRAFGQRSQFFLTRQPDRAQPFTVRSYTNEAACDADSANTGGTVVAENPNSGYTYDAMSNSIIFAPQATPPRGTCLKVKYKAACIAP